MKLDPRGIINFFNLKQTETISALSLSDPGAQISCFKVIIFFLNIEVYFPEIKSLAKLKQIHFSKEMIQSLAAL